MAPCYTTSGRTARRRTGGRRRGLECAVGLFLNHRFGGLGVFLHDPGVVVLHQFAQFVALGFVSAGGLVEGLDALVVVGHLFVRFAGVLFLGERLLLLEQGLVVGL